ncbi:MAG: hypothetical protein AB7G21_14150 [Dehalococcoidia bacterium]
MKTRAVPSFAVLLVAAASLLVACTGAGPEPTPSPTPTPSVTATPTPTATATPSPTPTPALPMAPSGAAIPPVVAEVIAAVTARQIGPLERLVQYQQVACTTAQGAGGPPKCRPGDTPGTVYRRFPSGACEGEWAEDAAPILAQIVTAVGGLHSVATLTPPQQDPEPYWPKGEVVVMFQGGGNGGPGGYFIVGGEKILRAHILCDRGAGSELSTIKALGGATFLIAPKTS